MGETRINCSELCQLPLLSLGKVTISIIFPVSRAGCHQLHLCWRYVEGGKKKTKRKKVDYHTPLIQFSLATVTE